MSQTSHVTSLSPTITTSDFTQAIKKVRERTSSSKSGRHYGLYKALVNQPLFVDRVVRLINVCSEYHILLPRWKKIVQVMICKSPGNFHLDKLRVIQLLEADLNSYLRNHYSYKLIRQAHRDNLISDLQFGSKPGSMSTSNLLQKVLSFDLIRFLRASAVIFNNDAKACYDRIIPSIALLCCQRLGLSQQSADFMLLFLREAEYHVKTGHGISDSWYSNRITEIYGVLQGSGSAPPIWLALSLLLLRALHHLTPPSKISHPNTYSSLDKLIDMFVDDSDLWHISHTPIPIATLVQSMTIRAQTWEKLLFLSGGKLNLDKCYWYLVTWTWVDGQPSLSPISSTPASLSLTSGNSTVPAPITRVESTSTLKTLGLWTSPSGQQQDEFDAILSVLAQISESLRCLYLHRHEADAAYSIYVIPKLRYVLACSQLSLKQCHLLDSKLRKMFMARQGINRNTSHSIYYGSHLYGGFQRTSTYDIQGTEHVNLLLGHLQLQDSNGNHLKYTMAYLYLLLGVPQDPLTYDPSRLKSLLPHSWLTTTWQYLHSIGATLTTTSFTISAQRHSDQAIMEKAIVHFGRDTLLRINSVRLYLKVFFLSDITQSDGKTIDPHYRTTGTSPTRTSTLKWPYQPSPPKNCWEAWRKMLRTCFTNRSYTLRTPLGVWLPVPRTQAWCSYFDPLTSRIFYKLGDHWFLLRHLGRFHRQLSITTRITHLPEHTVPISVTPVKDKYLALPFLYCEEILTIPPSPPTSFRQCLQQLPAHEKWVIGHVLPTVHISALLSDVSKGQFCLASDGSVMTQQASYSYRIQSLSNDSFHLSAHSRSPLVSTLQVKALGYLGALYVLCALHPYSSTCSTPPGNGINP